jgi:hypothetical protein
MPTIIFGGGKVDITDRTERKLGNLLLTNDYINFQTIDRAQNKFDYSKTIFSSSYIGDLLKISNIVKATDYEIYNTQYDYGTLDKTYKYALPSNMVYASDIRHSHDYDTQDTTEVSVPTSGIVLTIDYGTTISAKYVFVYSGARSNNSTGDTLTLYVKISNDGSNWTTVATSQYTVTSTAQILKTVLVADISFRYLQFYATSPAFSPYWQIRKIIIVY